MDKKMFECKKDWEIESGVYFEKGKKYRGVESENGMSNGVKTVRMYGEVGMEVNFHSGSDYFDI